MLLQRPTPAVWGIILPFEVEGWHRFWTSGQNRESGGGLIIGVIQECAGIREGRL